MEDKKITAKEYLGQVRHMEMQIRDLQDEIKRLKELAVGISALNCDEKVLWRLYICLETTNMSTFCTNATA